MTFDIERSNEVNSHRRAPSFYSLVLTDSTCVTRAEMYATRSWSHAGASRFGSADTHPASHLLESGTIWEPRGLGHCVRFPS